MMGPPQFLGLLERIPQHSRRNVLSWSCTEHVVPDPILWKVKPIRSGPIIAPTSSTCHREPKCFLGDPLHSKLACLVQESL